MKQVLCNKRNRVVLAVLIIFILGIATYVWATYPIWGYCTGPASKKAGATVEVWTSGSPKFTDITGQDGGYSINIPVEWADNNFTFYAESSDHKNYHSWSFYWDGEESIRYDFYLYPRKQ